MPVWQWGLTTAEHIVDDVLDLLRRLTFARPSTEMAQRLQDARRGAYDARSLLLDTRRRFNALWSLPLFRALPRTSAFWKIWLAAYRRAYLGGPDFRGDDLKTLSTDRVAREQMAEAINDMSSGCFGRTVADQLGLVATAVVGLRPLVEGAAVAASQGQTMSDGGRDDKNVLLAWVELMGDLDTPAHASGTSTDDRDHAPHPLRRGLFLSQQLPDHGSDQVVELVQISLQTKHAFATVTTNAADKLGGNRLGRFAGFLKESWRINDWTWGRLDAATMLCRVALEPRRVRRWVAFDDAEPRDMATRFVGALVDVLFPEDKPGDGFRELLAAVTDELEQFVFAQTTPADLPPTLEHLASLFAWAIQADIAAAELPALRTAVEADVRAGAARGTAGARFVAEDDRLLRDLKELPVPRRGDIPLDNDLGPTPEDQIATRRNLGIQALRAFDRAGVGREPIDQEASGDLLIRTGITAAAVGATMLDSPLLGVPAARPFTRAIRGVALVPYWLARGLTGGSQIARSLAVAGLAIGAATLGVSLLASSTPRWAALLGICAVLFSIGYSALRTGSLVHGLVLVSPTIPLMAYALAERHAASQGSDQGGTDASPLLLVVLALILGAILLGSMPGLVSTPLAIVKDHPVRTAVVGLVLVALVAGVVSNWLAGWTGPVADGAVQNVEASRRWVIARQTAVLVAVTAAAAVVLGVFAELARRGTSQLKTWHPVRQDEGDTDIIWQRARVAHPAAVAAAWAWVYACLAALAALVISLATSSAFDGPGRRRWSSPCGWQQEPPA